MRCFVNIPRSNPNPAGNGAASAATRKIHAVEAEESVDEADKDVTWSSER